MDDYEGEGRESAIASISSLQPNAKCKGVTQEQLSKFQELHRRRLQIKSRSNMRKKSVTRKSQSQYLNIRNRMNEVECSKLSNSSIDFGEESIHDQKDNVKTSLPSKKQQKLHWGLDTKEPWERKANM